MQKKTDPNIILTLDQLGKTYKLGKERVKALSEFSFALKKGEIVGILGPNGAGKTTAVKLIMGFIKADSGRVIFQREELEAGRPRVGIGYLPESFRPNPNLTVREYVTMQYNLSQPARARADRPATRARVTALLQEVGMEAFAGRRIDKLSKGMGQRVGLAQALAGEPDLIILDEPTSGLDPIGKSEVIDLLLGLKAAGKTILFCSHILAEVERLCDRIGIIVAGNLRFSGKVDDFLARHQAENLDQGFKKEVKCSS